MPEQWKVVQDTESSSCPSWHFSVLQVIIIYVIQNRNLAIVTSYSTCPCEMKIMNNTSEGYSSNEKVNVAMSKELRQS
jgi:hypothetical protein